MRKLACSPRSQTDSEVPVRTGCRLPSICLHVREHSAGESRTRGLSCPVQRDPRGTPRPDTSPSRLGSPPPAHTSHLRPIPQRGLRKACWETRTTDTCSFAWFNLPPGADPRSVLTLCRNEIRIARALSRRHQYTHCSKSHLRRDRHTGGARFCLASPPPPPAVRRGVKHLGFPFRTRGRMTSSEGQFDSHEAHGRVPWRGCAGQLRGPPGRAAGLRRVRLAGPKREKRD